MPKKRKLLEIYLENNSIQYEFNEQEEEIIVANNFLIHGILGKIQKNLLDLDSLDISNEEENSETQIPNSKIEEDEDGGESDELEEEAD